MRDIDVRLAMRERLCDRHRGDADTLIIEEMGVWSGSVRVDIAVINGELHGVELKSAKDTLVRLPAQAALYGTVFDRITLVVAEKHRQKAEGLVPEWWGIVAAYEERGRVQLSSARLEQLNPCLDPVQIARLLWKSERIAILERHGGGRGFKSASNEALCQRLTEVLSLEALRREARLAFKMRLNWSRKTVAY